MLERFRDDPSSVPDSWRLYFERQDIHPRFHNSTVTDAVARESGASQLAFDRSGSDQGSSMLQPSNGDASSVSQQVGVAGVPSSEGAPEVTVQPGSSRIETSGTATNGVASSRVEASSELIGAGSTNGTASADFASSTGAERSGALADEGTPRGSSSVQPQAEPAGEATLVPLRGAAKALATNMDQSLAVPTATSVRVIPAKALEVNRGIINAQLARQNRPKVSFGHLITYAIVRALVRHPRMYSAFVPGDQPALKEFAHINLGIAVDLVRPDGQRTLLVPVLREAETLDPRAFFEAYDRTIARVREQKATVEDFVGASVSVTNPGTLGTEHSVPRLMQGQGAIIGVGAIELPAEFKATDPRTLAELGISKTVTITSTYDHRIIQGAESGQFLADLSRLLTGEDGFYEEIFRSLDIAYPPTVWRPDSGSIGSSPEERALKQIRVHALINNYRERGHLLANLDPLDLAKPVMSPELDPATYGLTLWDLSRRFLTDGLAGTTELELAEILQILRDTYCGSIGFEYMHIQNPEEKRWLQRRIEGAQVQLTKEEQLRILRTLNDAEAFEKFLSTRYIGQKRFGLEGAESAIVFLTETLNEASRASVTEAVIGMAHRGRLNVLANIVGKSYRTIFEEFEGNLDPNSVQGSGDVKYHKGFSGTYVTSEGTEMPVTLASNPSHLEAVDGVVEGMVRAKQDLRGNLFEFGVLGILVHGDASFAGQGVVAETLNLSQLPGYRTGGTVHLVINNQVGFTTDPKEARSSVYASDLAKTIEAPIMHVNGDDPEAVLRCARLAVAYREAFHKDVVVDMVCYRRHGHNEGDEPSYTQPVMYRVIEHTESVRKKYLAHLVRSRAITEEEGEEALDAYLARLQQALTETREAAPPKPTSLPAAPRQNVPVEPVATAVAREWIDYLFGVLDRVPESFHLHPKLARQFAGRRELFESGEVDWALGEAFAFGTVLLEGRDIRMSGQDTRRGTFSHRHAALYEKRII
jgi:2-oxoglutarate decarboxylase